MGATKFIMGKGGKGGGFAVLGTLLYGGMRAARYAKIAENPNSISPIPVNVAGLPVWAARKLKGDKAAKLVEQVIAAPGKMMEMPLESFGTTGEGSFSQRISGKKNTQKLLGENADEKLNSFAMKTSSLGGQIATGMGNVLDKLNKQFNFSGKTETNLKQKEQELAELRESFGTVKNSYGRWDKIRQSVGLEVKPLAKDDEIQAALKSAPKRIDASVGRQRNFDNLSTMEKLNRKRAVEAINEKYATERKTALETGLKGIKGRKAKAEKTQEILAGLQQSYTPEEKRILKASQVQGGITDIEQKVKGRLEQKAKGKISGEVKRTVDKYVQTHEDIHELERKKKFWENPAEGLKERAKNLTLSEVADYTMRYGAVVQQSVHSIKSSKIELRTLKQLMADLNGGTDPRKISTFKALFSSDVAAPVKEARKQFWRSTLATYIPLIGGTIGQEKASRALQRRFGKDNAMVGIGVTAGFMALQNVGNLLNQGGNFLQTYADLRMSQEEGAELSAQHYATLLETASKDIKAMGGTLNHNTVLIAQFYALNQTPIAEVMQDIKSGKDTLIQRSHDGAELMKQMAAQRQQQEQQQNAMPMLGNNPLVQGEGKFTAQERNQPKGGPGNSFTERALASQESSNGQGLS